MTTAAGIEQLSETRLAEDAAADSQKLDGGCLPNSLRDGPGDDELIQFLQAAGVSASQKSGAFLQLHQRYAQLLEKVLAQYCSGQQAEDLAQDIWLQLWERPECYKPRGAFSAWLRRTARNKAIDEYRRRRPGLLPPAFDLADGAELKGSDWSSDLQDALEESIQKLPEDHQIVVRSRLEEQPTCQVATTLGVEVDRVYQMFFRAKTSLRRWLTSRLEHIPC